MSDNDNIKKVSEQIKKSVQKLPQKTTRKDIEFYSSGITLLDLCLGGGWGKGYISNICGWEGAGKTMVACEALGKNHHDIKTFRHKFDNAESGFSLNTKYLFNFDINLIEPRSEQVEHFEYNVESTLSRLKEDKDFIYVLDSLDGLSDDREKKMHKKDMARVKKNLEEDKETEGKGDFGGKAKKMSGFFRMFSADINKTKMHLMIISQLRDNVGVMFGNKATRSGGKALDFYAAQIVWLYKRSQNTRKATIDGRKYERDGDILVNAKVTKNKLGKGFRDCWLFIDLDMGVDNIKSNLYFLYDLITPKGELRTPGKLEWDGEEYTIDNLIKHIEDNNLENELVIRVTKLWDKIEDTMSVQRKRKY